MKKVQLVLNSPEVVIRPPKKGWISRKMPVDPEEDLTGNEPPEGNEDPK